MTALIVLTVVVCAVAAWKLAARDVDRATAARLRNHEQQHRERQLAQFIDEQHALTQEEDYLLAEWHQ